MFISALGVYLIPWPPESRDPYAQGVGPFSVLLIEEDLQSVLQALMGRS